MPLFFGTTLHEYARLPSTNAHALELLAKSKPNDGTVIVAHTQTAGRGQIGSSWQAAPTQNLTFSLILYPNFVAATAQFSLNQAISLGVYDFMAAHTSGVAIKWSNDILVRGKKIAGILIENALLGTTLQHSVVGIGININQTDFVDLPNATSLTNCTQKTYDLRALLPILLGCIEARYLQLRAGQTAILQTHYLGALYQYGEEACYERTATGEVLWGKIIGIAPDGRLELLHTHGLETFGIKEIRFV